MRALLLAAGLGTRLRPLTERTPKCLAPIKGKPLLEYWLDLLFGGGIDEVLVNLHYLPEQVRDHVYASPWRERISLVHEPELLGTAGTLLANRAFFGNEPLLLAHADNLTLFDPQAFVQAHASRPANAIMTMMTFRTDAPDTCGIVELDPNGIVTAFHEKVSHPPGNLANAAVYIFEPGIFDVLARMPGKPIDLSTQVIPALCGKIFTYENRNYHRDIGTMEAWELANRECYWHDR